MKDVLISHKGLQLVQQVLPAMCILCKAVTACVDGGECNLRKNGSRRIALRVFVSQSDALDPSL